MFCGGLSGYGFGSMASGWFFLATGFRVLIIVGLILLAFKYFGNPIINRSNDALKILDEKFARGEISEEEYIRRKTILSQRN